MFGDVRVPLSQVRHVWCQLCSGEKRPVGRLPIRHYTWRCEIIGAYQYGLAMPLH